MTSFTQFTLTIDTLLAEDQGVCGYIGDDCYPNAHS